MNIVKLLSIKIFFSIILSYDNSFYNEESIKSDFKNFMNNSTKKVELNKIKDQNILLAPLMSIIIPGSGQIYNKDYKRGYFYLSFEVLSNLYRKKYLSKSKEYERKYKDFANQHWSFEKWVRDYCLFADVNHPVYDTMINNQSGFFYPWDDSHHIEFYVNGELQQTNSANGSDWFRNTFLTECSNSYNNNTECNTDYFVDSEVVKDHHFYEGLGKYDLFFPGWDDTHDCDELGIDENCSFIFSSGNTNNAFTSNKMYYQYQLRSKANDKSDVAENALTLVFVNHAISMFDAFISNVIKNNNQNFNYYSSPIYDSSVKLNGINFTILW